MQIQKDKTGGKKKKKKNWSKNFSPAAEKDFSKKKHGPLPFPRKGNHSQQNSGPGPSKEAPGGRGHRWSPGQRIQVSVLRISVSVQKVLNHFLSYNLDLFGSK
jgi:hypothetical protein